MAARRKSTKSAGQTAMLHARALVAERWPGCPVDESTSTLSRIMPPGRAEPLYVSRREDRFGVADLVVFTPLPVLLQVTTWSAKEGAEGKTQGAASSRRTKLKRWALDHELAFCRGIPARETTILHAVSVMHLPTLLVLAYEARQGFHEWSWHWPDQRWKAARFVQSPILAGRITREEAAQLRRRFAS